MPQQRLQSLIIPIQIIQHTRGIYLLQRQLRHHFRHLFQRPRAARERNERIPQFYHLRPALRNILRHNQLRQPLHLKALADEKLRLHARHLRASRQRTGRQCAHQAGFRPAIHQRVAAFTNPASEFLHRLPKRRIVALVCPQINRNIHAKESPFAYLCYRV